MTARSVYLESGSVLADTHRAALRTLPIDYVLVDDAHTAEILVGTADFMRSTIDGGAAARTAVLVAPRSEPWEAVDALWAAVEDRGIDVVPATIDVTAIARFAPMAAPFLKAPSTFHVEVHLEALGVEETRLAQMVSLLDALDIMCPEATVRTTRNGWVAAAQDERMTLRAHCVTSSALTPRIRLRLSSANAQLEIDVPMAADARPLITTLRTAQHTQIHRGTHESPARAFWLALAAPTATSQENPS